MTIFNVLLAVQIGCKKGGESFFFFCELKKPASEKHLLLSNDHICMIVSINLTKYSFNLLISAITGRDRCSRMGHQCLSKKNCMLVSALLQSHGLVNSANGGSPNHEPHLPRLGQINWISSFCPMMKKPVFICMLAFYTCLHLRLQVKYSQERIVISWENFPSFGLFSFQMLGGLPAPALPSNRVTQHERSEKKGITNNFSNCTLWHSRGCSKNKEIVDWLYIHESHWAETTALCRKKARFAVDDETSLNPPHLVL